MNHLIIWKESSLFIGSNNTTVSEHQHPMIQLIIGVQDTFLWKNKSDNWVDKKALLVAPNHRHECNAQGRAVIIIGIDPESKFGQFVQNQYLHTDSIIDFPAADLKKINIEEMNNYIKESAWDELQLLMQNLFNYNSKINIVVKKDERIQNVLNFITTNIHTPITTQILMKVSFLSESRLLHLFKQEMGLPIRNFILWQRLRLAFEELTKGNSLTQAAYAAGFADQAHLTRTFVKTMGVTPSTLIKNSKFIQVSFPV